MRDHAFTVVVGRRTTDAQDELQIQDVQTSGAPSEAGAQFNTGLTGCKTGLAGQLRVSKHVLL